MMRQTHSGHELWVEILPGGKRYLLMRAIVYHSPRYRKTATVPAGFVFDGATGATDILTIAIPVHDWQTDSGLSGPRNPGCLWDDGSPCSRWHSSCVLGDILREDGYTFRAHTWKWATFLKGFF